jgi:hypothetical protein
MSDLDLVVRRDDPLQAGQTVTLAVTTYYEVAIGAWLAECANEADQKHVTLEEIEEWLSADGYDESIAAAARKELDAGFSEVEWSLGVGSSALPFESRYALERRRKSEATS